MTESPPTPNPGDTGTTDRVVRPRHRRAHPRVIVGMVLIVSSVAGVLALGQRGDGPPATRYLVASADVAVGTVVTATDSLPLTPRAIELPGDVRRAAIGADHIDRLRDHVVVAPVAAGDLVQWSDLAPVTAAPATFELAVALDARDALAGAVSPGIRVDVLATYKGGDGAFTDFLVRDVPVLAVHRAETGFGDNGLTVRLGLETDRDVQVVGHAQRTAAVFLARAVGRERERDDTEPYRVVERGGLRELDDGGTRAAEPKA